MKKKIILSICISMIFILSTACKSKDTNIDSPINVKEQSSATNQMVIDGDWPSYSTEKALYTDSDIVIIGEVLETNVETVKEYMIPDVKKYTQQELDDLGLFNLYTLANVKVIKVIKGKLEKDQILQIGERYGTSDTTSTIFKGTKKFEDGSKYRLLFLKDFTQSNPPGCIKTLNPSQADVELDIKFIEDEIDFKNSKIISKDGVFESGSLLDNAIKDITVNNSDISK